jgi:hypothetical protein
MCNDVVGIHNCVSIVAIESYMLGTAMSKREFKSLGDAHEWLTSDN